MAVGVLFFVVVIVFVVLAAAQNSAAVSKRRTVLDQLAAQLAGQNTGNAAVGSRNDIRVVYRFETRGSGSNSESWTEVEAEVPAKYPLAMYVRRQGRSDDARIARGEMIDVQIGDAAFDAAFLLEVAPADVARILLDQPTRSLLAAYDPVELYTITQGDKRYLRFAFRTWCEDPALALGLVDQVAGIAARVRSAFATADAATPQKLAGGPYRPQLDDAPIREAADARAHEVHHLEYLRATRPDNSAAIVLIMIGTAFVMLWALAAAVH